MNNNICKFSTSPEIGGDIAALNFVYERNPSSDEPMLPGSCMICIVAAGEASFRLTSTSAYDAESSKPIFVQPSNGDCPSFSVPEEEYLLSAGDIFFIFRGRGYRLCDLGGLEYMYISVVGTRVRPLLERLGVTPVSPVRRGYLKLLPFWRESILFADHLPDSSGIDLVAQSVLFYTLSRISGSGEVSGFAADERDVILDVKRYIDESFADPSLSLTSVAAKFGYNPKYLSERFKRTVRINLSEYLTSLRLEHARSLLDSGCRSVSSAAEASGYSDPLYFSKVFRRRFNCSPREYIKRAER